MLLDISRNGLTKHQVDAFAMGVFGVDMMSDEQQPQQLELEQGNTCMVADNVEGCPMGSACGRCNGCHSGGLGAQQDQAEPCGEAGRNVW